MLSSSHTSPALEGIKRALPIVMGYLPVGFAFGVLAVKCGIPAFCAFVLSLLMYSGSGQLILASMWGAHMSPLSIIAAVAIVNLRYLLQSAAETPFLSGLPRFKRFLLGMGVTDETFAVHVTAFMRGWERNLTTLFVTNHVAQMGWVGGTLLGICMGNAITDIRPYGLDYALSAMFLALLVLQLASKLHILVAVLTMGLAVLLKLIGVTQWNIAIATVVGATIGLFLFQKTTQRKKN